MKLVGLQELIVTLKDGKGAQKVSKGNNQCLLKIHIVKTEYAFIDCKKHNELPIVISKTESFRGYSKRLKNISFAEV